MSVQLHPVPGSREVVRPEAEQAIEAYADGSTEQYATANASPFSWNAHAPTATARVGWILKRGREQVSDFAFSINPQSITRTSTTRTQMFATRGGFYVDDFGAGPTTIQINQYVAAGKAQQAGGFETLREHVLRFYDTIWTPAAGPGYSNSPVEVFFYDNHLFAGLPAQANVPEKVYFPQNGFQILRAVGQNNVWQLQLTMVSLEKPSGEEQAAALLHGKGKTKLYLVREGETLKKFAAKHAARSRPTNKQILSYERAILKLNPTVTKNRKISIFSPQSLTVPIETREVKRNHLAPGELLTVPN
jgi:hypothetical protein